jgi:hypothetical protein
MIRSAIVTVAFGRSTENLDHTFTSFAEKNHGVPLHAFILGRELPVKREKGVTYHLVKPVADFSHPLREVYFRRLELIDQLDIDYALVVDSYDVLCLQPLPPFETILAGCDVAACVEHLGSRYVIGQGYTANFLNGGVFFWNVRGSRDIRGDIVERGRSRFRRVADDQHAINEVIQTRFYQRLRILPCQYNYRAYFKREQRGWPTVTHLDGVFIYHNGPCIDQYRDALRTLKVQPIAELPPLPQDTGPLNEEERFWRALEQWQRPGIVKESLPFRFLQWFLGRKLVHRILRLAWPVVRWLKLENIIQKRLPIG